MILRDTARSVVTEEEPIAITAPTADTALLPMDTVSV